MPRVIVVGGGAMGSAAAWQLATRGADVQLLEQFRPGHSNGSSDGSSRIYRLAYQDPFYVDLAITALGLWRRLEAEVRRPVLTSTGVVDHGPEAITLALHGTLLDRGRAADLLDPAAAARRWPGLRFDTSVLFHPQGGRLDADGAVRAFQQAATIRGARIRHDAPVAGIEITGGDRVRITTRSGAVYDGDAAVVAVGGWTEAVAGPLVGGLPPLRVTQEQPVHFPAERPLSAWPSFLHHGGAGLGADDGIYGLGSPDGVKVGRHGVGPVVHPSRRDRSIDADALRAIQDYAANWLPGVDASRPFASTCLYTSTPDHDFVVDRTGPITVLAGFSGHGFKFASAIGALAADLVLEDAPAPPRFALGRRPSTVFG